MLNDSKRVDEINAGILNMLKLRRMEIRYIFLTIQDACALKCAYRNIYSQNFRNKC